MMITWSFVLRNRGYEGRCSQQHDRYCIVFLLLLLSYGFLIRFCLFAAVTK